MIYNFVLYMLYTHTYTHTIGLHNKLVTDFFSKMTIIQHIDATGRPIHVFNYAHTKTRIIERCPSANVKQ